MISRSFLCFAHGPPITRLHSYDRNAAQLARPRRNPHGVDRGPLVASLFLQSDKNKQALQIRKNSAATAHPPIARGFVLAVARFRHPCAVTPLAAGVRSLHARASWASVAPAPPRCHASLSTAGRSETGRELPPAVGSHFSEVVDSQLFPLPAPPHPKEGLRFLARFIRLRTVKSAGRFR